MKLSEKLEKAKCGTPIDLFLDEIIKDAKELEAMLDAQQATDDNARYAGDFDPCTRVVLNCKYMQALGRIQDLEKMTQWQPSLDRLQEFLDNGATVFKDSDNSYLVYNDDIDFPDSIISREMTVHELLKKL